ncbi:PrsW family intramembrane metalloprotease [Streptomyces sp. NA02950]|uniref:PrsW family glutamic-type intramembrane protease n=1 Tax=Streptomyces sp. NA02950 TaxID=2742137 RepID=UPI0015902CD4|nr:PrsW family glutamic-type intramembrane protease [Streptomyces sp. NA02950]QKV92449.1 PrsW family intramembrane metalloprotease [Streptomyces sp. NA02950]
MALLMVAATVYGVAQLLVLSSPTRSVRISTGVMAIAVGVYGCGVAAALLELAYTRSAVELTGNSLNEVVKTASYTADPVIEELIKVAPLVLIGWNVRIRRQWGLTDCVVLGAGLGAGFGLLEAVARYGLDAERAIAHPAGGWAIPDSLRAPYIPGPDQVFSTWFPAPQAALELGDPTPAAVTSPHLVYTVLTALGIGVLFRARGWLRALGALPLVAACAHHTLTNYAAAHPTDRDAASRVDTFEGVLWAVPLVCLAFAMAVDLGRLRRGKTLVPDVLLRTERAGRSGLGALAAYGAWCVPWSALIALRFARLRRGFLYGVAGAPYPGADALHRTVVWSVAQIDASDREHAWRRVGLRAVAQAGRGMRDWRRKWFALVSFALALPALILLGVGSFPAAAEVQHRFASGNGPRVLVGFGVVALLWTGWQLIRLLRAWRWTLALPHGEVLALIRLRIWTALGGCVMGALLLFRLGGGTPPDGPVIRSLHLLEALDNFLAYLGFALMLLAVLALLSPGSGLGFALVGARVGAGVITQEAAIHAAVYGTLGVVLMAAVANGGGEVGDSGSTSQRDVHSAVRRGERDVDVDKVWQDGELYIDVDKGNMIKVLDRGDGTSDIVIKDPSNPSGEPITSFNAKNGYVERHLGSGAWE